MSQNAFADRLQAFRGVAGHLVTGVSVVVTMVDGEPLATTAGSVVAASWDPPLIAVLFWSGSRMDVAIDRSRRLTVNVLGEADAGLAQRYARPDRRRGWEEFSGVALLRRDPHPPLLTGAAAWLDCVQTDAFDIGDHRCHVADILEMDRADTAAPLVYYRGRFRGLGAAVAPASWSPANTADLLATW